MKTYTQPFRIILSKLTIQAKIAFWKFKYVSGEMIKH